MFHSLQPMSLHMGGPLSEQSFTLLKTQFSNLEAKIPFNVLKIVSYLNI